MAMSKRMIARKLLVLANEIEKIEKFKNQEDSAINAGCSSKKTEKSKKATKMLFLQYLFEAFKNPTSENLDFRMETAKRYNKIYFTDGLLKMIAEDPDWQVREALAKNPETPREALEELSLDGDDRVARAAEDNLYGSMRTASRRTRRATGNFYKWMIQYVIENPSRGNVDFRIDLASKDYNMSDKILRLLAYDPDYRVRHAVAMNPTAPRDLLEDLASDDEEEVAEAAEDNLSGAFKGMSVTSRRKTAGKGSRKAGIGLWLGMANFIMENPKPDNLDLRIEMAKETREGYEGYRSAVLKKLVDDPDWQVRLEVAKNPKASIETLEKLSFDDDDRVAEAAEARL